MSDPFDSYTSYLQVLNSLVQASSGPSVASSAGPTSSDLSSTINPPTTSLMTQEEQAALQRELSLWQSTHFTQMDSSSSSSSPSSSSPSSSTFSSSSSSSPTTSHSLSTLPQNPLTQATAGLAPQTNSNVTTPALTDEEEHLDFFRLAPEDRQQIVTNMDHPTAFALLDPCALPSQTKVPKAALSTQPIPIAPSPYTRIPPPSNAHVLPSTTSSSFSLGDTHRRTSIKSSSSKKAKASNASTKSSTSAGPTPPSALSAPLPNNKRKRSSPAHPPPLKGPSLSESSPSSSSKATATALGDLDPSKWVVTPEGDVITLEEDKRRRNTAASARFRQKKKLRESELERTAEEQTERANALQSRVDQLEQEVKWLKGLLVEKDPALIGRASTAPHVSVE